jgi:hypothetical protein
MRSRVRTALVAGMASIAIAGKAHAQHASNAESDSAAEHYPRLLFGTTAGTLQYAAGRTQSGASLILEFQPVSWLNFSANPAYARVSDTALGQTVISSGITDLPLSIGVSHELALPMSPSVGIALTVTLPAGDTAIGLGSGGTSLGLSASTGFSPTESTWLGADAGRPLEGTSFASGLDGATAGWLGLEASYSLTKRIHSSLSFSTDFSADSGGTSRSVAGGLAFDVAPPLTLTIDASHRLSGTSPNWAISIGLGTAFSGLNPLGPTSSLRRLESALPGSVNRGRGNGHLNGATRGKSGTAGSNGNGNGKG